MKRFLAAILFLIAVPSSGWTEPGQPLVLLQTTAGDIVAALEPELAPDTAAQFLALVRSGAYDSVRVHFADRDSLIQFSNVEGRRLPATPDQKARIRPLKAEFGGKTLEGSLIMAREPDDPDSASTSFSILLADAPHLEGRYTVFGRVTRGFDVAQAIGEAPVDGQKRPVRDLEIENAVVLGAEDLNRMDIRGPIVPASENRAVPKRFLGLLAAMIAVGLFQYSFRGRISAEMSRSLSLLPVFIGFFALFTAFLPQKSADPLWGTVFFASLLGVIKLMGRFEDKGRR